MKMLKAAVFLFLLILVSGCNFLDYDESTDLTKEDVFSNFDRSKSYLTNIYSYLPSGFNSIDGAMRASASDNAEENQLVTTPSSIRMPPSPNGDASNIIVI